jgi:hypothetical protein
MKDYVDAQNLLKPCLDRINSLQGNFSHIETLRIFYLVLHISCSSFGLGQVCSITKKQISSIDFCFYLDKIIKKCLDTTSTKYSKSSKSSRRRLFLHLKLINLRLSYFRKLYNHKSIRTIYMVIS